MLKFLVPESRVTQAREIIEAFLEESEASSGEIICPHCGALVPQWKIICPGCGNNLEQK